MHHGLNRSGHPAEMPFVRIPYLFARLTPMLAAPFIKSAESKDRELNNLNNITRLLARLLRCAKAHIRKVCDLQRALNTNQNPSQSLFNLFRPRSELFLSFFYIRKISIGNEISRCRSCFKSEIDEFSSLRSQLE
jgi:hypothetical protein